MPAIGGDVLDYGEMSLCSFPSGSSDLQREFFGPFAGFFLQTDLKVLKAGVNFPENL
jgi:hypothetical protein